jgi:Domain of unknown function (DUF4124)
MNEKNISAMVANTICINLIKRGGVMERVLALILFIGVAPIADAEIYKWIDEQGRVHYSDKEITNAETLELDTAKKGHISTGASREEKRRNLLDAMQEDKDRQKKEQKKSREQKKKHDRACVLSKHRLSRFERASYLYDLDKDGNKVIASNEDRSKKTSRLRKNIKKHCK